MKIISLRMPANIIRDLKLSSEKEKIKPSSMMRIAIISHLKKKRL